MLECKPTIIYVEEFAVIQFDTEVRNLSCMKHCTKYRLTAQVCASLLSKKFQMVLF